LSSISEHAIIHPNVIFGENVTVEEFCVVGCPFKGSDGEPTVIGDNATLRSGTVIYAGNRIGNNFQTGNKANIRELNDIGDDVSVGTLSVIEHHVSIADGVRVHTQVFIPEYSTLKEDAWVGPNVVFTNAKYPRSANVKNELAGPIIGKNVKLGANSTLLPGVKIGNNSIVGAGSVVTKDVPEGVIVVGNPARPIRNVDY